MQWSSAVVSSLKSRKRGKSPPFTKLHNQDKIGHCHIWASSEIWLIWKECQWGKVQVRFSGNFGSKVISCHLAFPLAKRACLYWQRLKYHLWYHEHIISQKSRKYWLPHFSTVYLKWWYKTCHWAMGSNNMGLFLGPLSSRTESDLLNYLTAFWVFLSNTQLSCFRNLD